MKYNPILIFLFILFFNQIKAQSDDMRFEISNSILISSKNQPFWFWANRDGKVIASNNFLNLTDINFSGIHHNKDSIIHIISGANLITGLGNNSQYVQINQLYGGLNVKGWEIRTGLWVNDLQFGGLSTSNGNIAKSRNPRPHPRISLLIPDYKPLPWVGKYVMFKGEYEEGWLNDDRYMTNAYLHHKSFYLKFQFSENFDFQGGLEHFVMWGGKSQNERIGKMPTSLSAYFKYITGQRGDEEFLPIDQINLAGNQYGAYQFIFTYKFTDWNLIFNISHPIDDISGLNLTNWRDNLLGLYFSSNDQNGLITDIIYEYVDTRNQSAPTDSPYYFDEESQTYIMGNYDNYFNHLIYKSGATYQKMAMVSPLFYPIIIENNISMGFESTRFIAHHIGAKGKIVNDFNWKGMTTFIQHFGTYEKPYTDKANQLSTYFQLFYNGPKIPINLGIEIAADKIKNQKDNLGLQLIITKYW